MEQYITYFDSKINNTLEQFVRKPTIIRGIVHLLLILYAARLAPSMPKAVLDMFENSYFKLFIFALILWTAQFSPSTSLLIAVAFMVTMNYVNKRPLWEFLENTEDATSATAPTKEAAVDSAVAVIENQVKDTPVVDTVTQKQGTIVVQPTIVDTPEGKTVVNPTVVIAPVVVTNAAGEKVMVKPDVTMVEPEKKPEAAQAAPEQAAAPETTGKTSGSCYPIRSYNAAKVVAYSANDFSEFTKA